MKRSLEYYIEFVSQWQSGTLERKEVFYTQVKDCFVVVDTRKGKMEHFGFASELAAMAYELTKKERESLIRELIYTNRLTKKRKKGTL